MFRAYRRIPEAIKLLEQLRERQELLLGSHHWSTLDTLMQLGLAYQDAGNTDQALLLFHQSVSRLESQSFLHLNAGQMMFNLCACLEQLQKYDQAEVWRRKWVAALKVRGASESEPYAVELLALGRNLLRQNKYADAEPFLRESLTVLPNASRAHPRGVTVLSPAWTTANTQALLGAALLGQRKYAEAEPFLVQGYEAMVKSYKEFESHFKDSDVDDAHRDILERLVQLYREWGNADQEARGRKELEAAPKK